jgi:outer membrane protein assembly factor BamB
MDDSIAFADTHSYAAEGNFKIIARVKVGSHASSWSAALDVTVEAGEGAVIWAMTFTDPEEPTDSAGFDFNSFGLNPDGTSIIACSYGAVTGRRQSGVTWRYVLPGGDEFTSGPVIADDGTIYIGCTNDTVYAINPDGTPKWQYDTGSPVAATGALGTDGTFFCQTEDSVIALTAAGARLWAFYTGGGHSSPVIGTDGIVYVGSDAGLVYAFNPGDGSAKWSAPCTTGTVSIVAAPAIDTSRSVLYVTNDDGLLWAIGLDGTHKWSLSIGQDASAPVIGSDGTVYVGANGMLSAINPDDQSFNWRFSPPLAGVVSTPAVSSAGYIYVLVTAGKKGFTQESSDSMYAVNPDGTQRWASGLGEGTSDPDLMLSAPKIDASGRIYIGNGTRGWCLVGVGGPAQSVWPMCQRDARNTGRAQ